MAHDSIVSPFLFHEQSINRFNYCDVLEMYATPSFGDGLDKEPPMVGEIVLHAILTSHPSTSTSEVM